MFNKKEYDRARQRTIYADFKQRRVNWFKKFANNRCFLCNEKRDYLHLHHTEYHPTESNYPRHSKSQYVRNKRLKEAEGCPSRFKALCASCHWWLEILKKKNVNIENLIILLK